MSGLYRSMAEKDHTVVISLSVERPKLDDIETVLTCGAQEHGQPGYWIYRPKGGTSCCDVFFGDGVGHRMFCWFQLDGLNDGKYHLLLYEFDRDGYLRAYLDNKVCPTAYDISSKQTRIQNHVSYSFMKDHDGGRACQGDGSLILVTNNLLSGNEKIDIYEYAKRVGLAQ